jgi:uncharacterized protein
MSAPSRTVARMSSRSSGDAELDELASVVQAGPGPIPDDGVFAVRSFAGPERYAEIMDPIRVAHLTDQHFGRVTPMQVQKRALELVREGKPDMVVITGDFVCHSQLYLDAMVEALATIEAPTFAVLGNHDHWSGADEVRRGLRKAGVELLDNAHTTITLRHQKLQVLGLDDAYTGHADAEKALRGLHTSVPTLALSHIAEEADRLWARGIPMVLSGHTHAGQITLAKMHEMLVGRVAGHRYVHGLYGDRRAPSPMGSVYVGAGIGAAVMPVRIGERAKREVAFFDLGVAPDASVDEHHVSQIPLPGRKPSEATQRKRALAVMKKRMKRERRTGEDRRDSAREGRGRRKDGARRRGAQSGCDARKCSAESAPMQPEPAAVTACRHRLSCTSPTANTPGTLVSTVPGLVTT